MQKGKGVERDTSDIQVSAITNSTEMTVYNNVYL